MTEILVVDDSAIERTIISSILSKNFPDANVLTADGGLEALDSIDHFRFDLVITDLMMPEIDGLKLVQEVQSRGLNLPVILMTGFGSEEIALSALRAGAASYVPKRAMDLYLVPTVENILSLSRLESSSTQLLSSVYEAQFKLAIGNDVGLVAPLVDCVQKQIIAMHLFEESDVLRLSIALHEALMNAILHGNLEVDSHLKQIDESSFDFLVNERSIQNPFCQRQVFVTVTLTADSVEISVRDQGPGFDVGQVTDPDRRFNFEQMGGRGLLLIQSFMDVVRHSSSGNEITMIKFTKPTLPGVGVHLASRIHEFSSELTNLGSY